MLLSQLPVDARTDAEEKLRRWLIPDIASVAVVVAVLRPSDCKPPVAGDDSDDEDGGGATFCSARGGRGEGGGMDDTAGGLVKW